MASNSTRNMSSIATPKDDSGILLQAIFGRLTKIELKLETLTTVANKVENFEKELKQLWCTLDDFNKRFADRVSTCESKIDNLEFSDVTQKSQIEHVSRQNSELRDEITYLKSLSMRNNLLFGGINEPENERPQDVEAKVRSFIIEK
ncbi:hypothetical protein DPMN_081761 [Dreissena polymorpha]|uniref:Uncharacterized protein n=1 Tax=Dreissena polymorpha TaxID=45954 RepID=A0A9D3Y7W4_DREPO|nr:hypothetical protein DPMN_081761 [Dreissena polymorpha]